MIEVVRKALTDAEADLQRAKEAFEKEQWNTMIVYLYSVNSAAMIAGIAAKKIEANDDP